MSEPGERERRTQSRLVRLFQDRLAYEYLGNWTERANSNIEEDRLRSFLVDTQGYELALADRAIFQLKRAGGGTNRFLYDRNRDVYGLLRYGVKLKTDVGEQTQTLWLIDWAHPERNHFAIAEEVTVQGSVPAAHPKRPDIVIYVNGIAVGILELKRSIVCECQAKTGPP
jgi:type I restriction enzyme R subunit